MLESGYVEQLIEDDALSPFQQVLNTERPDRVIGALLEGRVAILLDGTPLFWLCRLRSACCSNLQKTTMNAGFQVHSFEFYVLWQRC